MGSIVMAECSCGLKTEIMIGGGMLNFQTPCYFPFLCEHCSAIVRVNMFSERKDCPQCMATNVIPYDDPSLSGHTGTKMVDGVTGRGQEHILTDGSYKCPKCNQYSLRFWNCGNWD